MWMLRSRVVAKVARSYTQAANSRGLPLLYRDVFIMDDAWSLQRWEAVGTTNMKHPASKHVAAAYATYMFNNSSYHFNSVGEYSLNFSASHTFAAVGAGVGTKDASSSPNSNSKTQQSTHSVLLWPDRLLVQGLTSADVPQMMKLLLKPEALIRSDAFASHVRVLPMPKLVVVVVSNSNSTSLLQWLEKSSLDRKGDEYAFLLTAEMKGHRNGTNVMVLPHEDCFEWIPQNQESAGKLMAKYV